MSLSCERTGNIAFAGSIHRIPPDNADRWRKCAPGAVVMSDVRLLGNA